MKLRAVFNRRREVLELFGDAITLGNCREAVNTRFGLRINTFRLSLNGQDFLDDDSVLLTDLGIVNGDLIYVLPNTAQQEDVQRNQTTTCNFRDDLPANQNLPHQGHTLECTNNPDEHSLAASTSQCEDSQPSRGKESSSRTEAQHHTASASSLRSCILLCRDGIPEALADLYRTSDVGTVHEAAWVVIHFLMLETGYICASEHHPFKIKALDLQAGRSSQLVNGMYQFEGYIDTVESTEAENFGRVVPAGNWKKGGIARIKYMHTSCPGLMCSLSCTSLGPFMMVHGVADSVSNSEVYQCRLQPTDFVRGNVDLRMSGAASVYYNLHRLTRLIKDQVAYPLLSFMRTALGLPQLCGLMALPAEVKLMILGRLPVHCILNVACTCRELRSLANDSTLWQHLVFRDFGRRVKEQNRSWKVEYVTLYQQKKTQEEIRGQWVVPPPELFPPGHGIGSQPFRGETFPPGIRGGHSDLFPNLPFMSGGFDPTPGLPPGARPGLRFPRPRFDPFGPLPDINQMPGRSRRGRRPGPPGNFPPGFL